MINFPHAVMFHHFHDDILHERGQGSISKDEFKKIITYLTKKYNILNPTEFINKLTTNKLSRNDIALTFDDALRCQYDIAIPVLEEFSIKGFFFVYTNAFKKNPDPLEFYRDIRNNYFKDIEEFYSVFFRICINKFPEIEKIFEERYSNNFLHEYPHYTYSDRKFRFMRDRLLKESDYHLLMDNIIRDIDYSKNLRRNILFMNINHLRDIKALGHNIGMHSSSHPTNMDELDKDKQFNEYKENYEFIEKNFGHKPDSMSHPLGRYTDETLKILNNMNIKIGFRSNLNNDYPRSKLEVPREDHINVLKLAKGK